ncbi:MAG: prephenate dehydratase [Crenarchaeota archaeon]|nr:prephenate dehydratase [Thermoproteota archaeon]
MKEISEKLRNVENNVRELKALMETILQGLTIADALKVLSELAREFQSREVRLLLSSMLPLPVSGNARVGFLGPEGTFTHEVALEVFGSYVSYVSYDRISDVLKAVSRGDVEIGVVPFENSLEGIVHETLDSLESLSNLYVNLCIEKRINMCLVVSDDVKRLEDVEVLYAQPYALAQCRFFVNRRLRQVREIVFTDSTSKSLDLVRDGRKCACLASKLGARMRGMRILLEHVEDFESYTRFVLVSRVMFRNGDRTGIIFTVRHTPGSLYNALECFARRGINLTMIYSRPLRKMPWSYYFYLEYEGPIADDVLRDFEGRCSYVRLLGSYVVLQSVGT